MIYINVWDCSVELVKHYEVTIGNADEESSKANEDYMDSHLVVRTFSDVIRANVFAQQLYNIVSEGKGTAVAMLHTL